MSITLKWAGDDDRDRVAETRLRAFGHATKDWDHYRDAIHEDPRGTAGNFLLAEDNGRAVGTATSYALTMWMRGAAVPCQGVAYVGTIKTHRRNASGVASRMMQEIVRGAREREFVVTALMPFRVSFYQHFGYGIVERRNEWTVPTTIFPSGDFSSIRMAEASDHPAIKACRERYAKTGQCDAERPDGLWTRVFRFAEDGFVFVDREGDDGPVRGWLSIKAQQSDGRLDARVTEIGYENLAALQRQLCFLGSLRDQYHRAVLELPVDIPLNWLLREREISQFNANRHPEASVRHYSRMQMRVLDHRRLIESMHLPPDVRGKAVVSVRETEGTESRFAVEIDAGRATAANSSAAADFECPDTVWAAVVSGDLPASAALRSNLATGSDAAGRLLDAFAQGPKPFCNEYF